WAFGVFREALLLFGIGALALPAWDQLDEGDNLNSVLTMLPRWKRVPARPLFILRPAKDIHPPLADLVIRSSSLSFGRPAISPPSLPLAPSGTHHRQQDLRGFIKQRPHHGVTTQGNTSDAIVLA